MCPGGFMVISPNAYANPDMAKILLRLTLILALFFGVWFALSRIDWVTRLKLERTREKTAEKLGKLYWDVIRKMQDEINDPAKTGPIDSLILRICEANDIDRKKIKLHLVSSDMVNAFALPDHHLVLFSGLIRECDSAEELCGVLAHEIAHMEEGHIMRKLIKEIGLSTLISMTTGGGNPDLIRGAIKTLSSTAYDRNLEREADITGANYLIKAGIDPEPFAAFLFKLSAHEEDLPEQVFWITTHPASTERSKDILNHIAYAPGPYTPVMDSTAWASFKAWTMAVDE